MRQSAYLLFATLLLFLSSCQPTTDSQTEQVDSLCLEAYRSRYSDIETTSALLQRAMPAASSYPEGRARIFLQMGFVRYQKMDFEGTLALIDSAYNLSHNQITLLCGDVLRMKVCQRIGDAGRFYEASSSGQRRLERILSEESMLDHLDQHFFLYAQTEYHFISSTYYYYQELDSLAKDEMQWAAEALSHSNDTTQLAYYHYMMGSGGLIDGAYDDVAEGEFDHLARCYSLSRKAGLLYFEANALQAMATRLKTSYDRELLSRSFPEVYQIILSHTDDWLNEQSLPPITPSVMTDTQFDATEPNVWLPVALASRAVHVFRQYDDLFQTACAYRTLGEMESDAGHYEHALDAFQQAISCVNRHHVTYYPCHDDTLNLFRAEATDSISTERRWIEHPDILTVPEWMAGIRHELSLIYAALDQKEASDYNRNIYLDILECTSPNREMESRLSELQDQLLVQNYLLLSAVLLFVFVLVMFGLFIYRQVDHDITHLNLLNRKRGRILRTDKQRVNALNDTLEELQEETEVSRMHIARHKGSGAEKRAKVSLVQAVVPFLDRIINEVARMNRQHDHSQPVDPAQLAYVTELADQIISYNNILTDWIKIEQGQLSLKISTVKLGSLFAILEQGHYAFDQQGVKLNVKPTDLAVKADEALTLFMLNTLADNARKFTSEGGSVTIEAIPSDDYIELSVRDTGCGMRQEDVDTILSSKVYDASKIGTSELADTDATAYTSKKGHGFGLMNCKGIIEKYRKTANIFSVCYFGIESRVGEGSRFFFRLPRVMMFLLVMVLGSAFGTTAEASDVTLTYKVKVSQSTDSIDTNRLYRQVCLANEEGRYEDALLCADSVLQQLSTDFLLYDQRMPAVMNTPDLQAFARHDSLDYDLLIRLRNEAAIAALGLHEPDLYQYNNRICVALFKLYHQDESLPDYYDKLKQADSGIRQIIVLLVLLTILAIILAIRLLRSRKQLAEQLVVHLNERIDQQRDELNHLRFEENRFYVQNQVLDNCLSTIKHESMYYPSRIHQLADRMLEQHTDELSQLTELTAYYKQLYTLLISQAERQTQQSGLRRQRLTLASATKSMQAVFSKESRRQRSDMTMQLSTSDADGQLIVDQTLFDELFNQLFRYLLTTYSTAPELQVSISPFDERTMRFSFRIEGLLHNAQQAHDLFTPSAQRIPLLVVRQIVRDLDALANNPGLRLIAESDCIWFTLPAQIFTSSNTENCK